MRNVVSTLFYGNIFYGLCALALCLETNLQHGFLPNGPHFYFLVFCGTLVYYTGIYYKSRSSQHADARTLWYRQHQHTIASVFNLLLALIAIDVVLLLLRQHTRVYSLTLFHWCMLLVYPLVAFLYTFKTLPFARVNQLRKIGWLKPFFIGFAWAGLVTVYPLLFRQMQSGTPAAHIQLPVLSFWLQNFIFISALAVLFDIKDHRFDRQHQLKTYPALIGVQKTILLLVIPLSLLGAGILLLHGFTTHSGIMPIALQLIPYILLWFVLTQVQQNAGILFYLFAIDGLMLVKGICGIISTIV